MSDTMVNLSLERAQDLVAAAFTASGLDQARARSVAAALVTAEAEGQVGHGFSRIADYVAQLKSGKVNGSAIPTIIEDRGASLLMDAQNGFAYPALDALIPMGIARAQDHGIAAMGITRSHHCGSLSVQVEKIARAGLIGIMVANTPKAIAPFGGQTPIFGTNPIAFAAPRPAADPLVLDMSLSVVARGKLLHAQKTGQSIPEGWAIDADGNATTDPAAGLAGSMLPIGGPKGTGLALLVEVLSALVTGANTSAEASSFFAADGPPPGVGQFLLAIRPMDNEGRFAQRIEALLQSIEAQEGARIPGVRRFALRSQADEKGLDIPRSYYDLTEQLAQG